MYARLLASVAALGLMSAAAQAEFKLHVLHINDLHSRLEAINATDSTCGEKDQAEGKCFGGAARVGAKINQLRDELTAKGENVVVLDAGDQYQGSLFYTHYKGAAEGEIMEMIGFDLMTLGNHEFDDGPEAPLVFLDKVSFPVISGNLDLSQTPALRERVGKTHVLEVGGDKIGFVSALTRDTMEIAAPGDKIIFQEELEALRAQVADLEGQGVNKIIALTHVGLPMDMQIAAEVAGIDAIVGGHSHSYLSSNDRARHGAYPTWVEAGNSSVPIVQAYAYSKYVGHVTLEFDEAGKLLYADGNTILLDNSVTPDPKIAERIAQLAEPIEELRQRVVSETTEMIEGNRDICRQQECTMGNLVTEAMLDRVKDQGITIALQSGGGLRASIDAGEITMGEVLAVLPFQNTLATFQAKGATLIAALENGVGQVEDGAGRFPHFAGLTYAFDPAAEAGARVSDIKVRQGDEWVAIDPEATYGVVSTDYLRRGGDGYRMLADEAINPYDFGPDLAEVVASYLAKVGPYTPALDGRILRK